MSPEHPFHESILALSKAIDNAGIQHSEFKQFTNPNYWNEMKSGWIPDSNILLGKLANKVQALLEQPQQGEVFRDAMLCAGGKWSDVMFWEQRANIEGKRRAYKDYLKLKQAGGVEVFENNFRHGEEFELKFLEILRFCDKEKVSFSTSTKYPPFFSRSRDLQERRMAEKLKWGLISSETASLVLERYDLWERILTHSDVRVIMERTGHAIAFKDKDYYFVRDTGHQKETLLKLLSKYPRLHIGISDREIPMTIFCAPSKHALEYVNMIPNKDGKDTRPLLGRGISGSRAETYFADFRASWGEIPDENKSRDNVARWIDSLEIKD